MYDFSFFKLIVGFLILICISIIIFLILREYWCWYWKINARKKIMEEQTEMLHFICNYIKKKPDAIGITLNSFHTDEEIKKRFPKVTHRVVQLMGLYSNPSNDSNKIMQLLKGDPVCVIKTETVRIVNFTSIEEVEWSFVEIEDSKQGWCYSSNLRSLNYETRVPSVTRTTTQHHGI